MREIAEAIYVFLPAGVANATPPLLTRFLGPGRAIDGGRQWRGRPLLGAHKTWQGLIGGSCAGIATFALQRRFDGLDVPMSFGIAISVGALAGDLVKSFVKRRLAVVPGRSWFPFDQIDYVIGGLAAGALFVQFPPVIIAATIAAYFVLHLVVSAIGYALGIKTAPI
ncbi:MAG TPA: CDP-archaeol synthase [Thermoanaerobaculia bacterium]